MNITKEEKLIVLNQKNKGLSLQLYESEVNLKICKAVKDDQGLIDKLNKKISKQKKAITLIEKEITAINNGGE